VGWALLVAADDAGAPDSAAAALKVSRFAPAKDLKAQTDYYLGRLQESLAARGDYDEAKQSRVGKDANTLAVLGLALAMHDEDNAVRGKFGLVRAAQALAASSRDYDGAAQALARARQAAAGETAAAGEKPAWQKVAALESLMKQVPIVHSALKRGIEGRFQRQAAAAAGQAATLAAIAEAARFDSSAVKNPADAGSWRRSCAEMRDAAGEVNSAAHAGDQVAARAGLVRLAKSCDACHAAFRREN
jgi:hypothetical protein